jgi:hypothetical protein
LWLGLLCPAAELGCAGDPATPGPDCTRLYEPASAVDGASSALRVNEVVSDNDGVEIDELGETDDYVELYNAGKKPLELATHFIADENDRVHRLPARRLAAGETVLLWADEELEQGATHLPFKISAGGDRIALIGPTCVPVDRVKVPALQLNESFARFPDGGEGHVCRYASPGRRNGESCEPADPPELSDDVEFAPYAWPERFAAPRGPLVISELALRPASYVEVVNIGQSALALGEYALRIDATGPGLPPPGADAGTLLAWPAAELAPGARLIVAVTDADVAAIEANPEREGVVSVFDAAGTAVERVDFMQLPPDSVLARVPDHAHALSLCSTPTPEAETTDCVAPEQREVGDRLRHLRSHGDFRALAAGGSEVGLEAVKFVLDMEAGDSVHLLGAERWALHYTFVRERIEGQAPLDRCDPAQDQEFNQGWFAFSQKEYFKPEGRRYLLGTLVYHASGMHTVEFTSGDMILGEQMRRAFFAVVAHTSNPRDWFLRASDDYQIRQARTIEGSLPIVGPNAPFVGLRYQPLTRAVGYGVLRFVPSDDLAESELGPRVILVTDDVPNDIPFVGGLITESFQTPLAHVNVLSQSRGTPNMALRGAHLDERLAPLFGKLVRLEVGSADLDVREATAEEADAFWIAQRPDRPPIVAPIDTSVRGVQALPGRGIADAPALGAKAAQYAELYRVSAVRAGCPQRTVPLNVPRDAFAIPVVHYLEHFAASGAQDKLAALLVDADFRADPVAHERGLAELRGLILGHPVEAELLGEVTSAIGSRFGGVRVRFRSSSNSEDLPEFNGAGLHTSVSVELGDRDRDLHNGLRTVWASLWNTRAFDERDFANVDQGSVAMGVLVHEAELGEAAQGVAISRTLRDLTRLEVYYLNAQRGEASVTNPAPGVTTEELLFTFPPRGPALEYLSSSSLSGEGPVLPGNDAHGVACALASVHLHFRPLLDPARENRLFAMQIEWKLERGTRAVIVKQARPQPFGSERLPADCREAP